MTWQPRSVRKPFRLPLRGNFQPNEEGRTATAISPDRPQRRPCRWKPSQGSSPKFSLNFCPFYFPSIYEFDSRFEPERQRSAVATISSSSVFLCEISLCVASLAPARLIRRFPNLLLLRSCLWQSMTCIAPDAAPCGLTFG